MNRNYYRNTDMLEGFLAGIIAGALIGNVVSALILCTVLKDSIKIEVQPISETTATTEVTKSDSKSNDTDDSASSTVQASKDLDIFALDHVNTMVITDYPLEPMLMDVPDCGTNMFTYMDYRAITNIQSPQWIYQQVCATNYYGIREIEGYFAVAMGSYYSTTIGDTFHITLTNGAEFDVFLADCKDDSTTDETHMGHPTQNYDGEDILNVLEFVVDENKLPDDVKKCGTFTALDIFGGLYGDGGNIESIEFTGNLELIDEDWTE